MACPGSTFHQGPQALGERDLPQRMLPTSSGKAMECIGEHHAQLDYTPNWISVALVVSFNLDLALTYLGTWTAEDSIRQVVFEYIQAAYNDVC